MSQLQPRGTPCPTCPYLKSCPSGVWDASEYAKLEAYDRETFRQPAAVFMCHDARDGTTMCRGWLDTHQKIELLSLRVAVTKREVSAAVMSLEPSGVPVFASGRAAAKHGMRDIRKPGKQASRVINKLSKRIEGRSDGSVSD